MPIELFNIFNESFDHWTIEHSLDTITTIYEKDFLKNV